MRGSLKGENSPGPFILVAGLLLFIIGYVGLFFGRLIKAAISRQREFLSDASAVQFTRNPSGLVSLLKKITTKSAQGKQTINAAKSEEVSHMYFTQGVMFFFNSLFATHPPLRERITKWDSQYKSDKDQVPDDPVIENADLPISNFNQAGSNSASETISENLRLSIGDPDSAAIAILSWLYNPDKKSTISTELANRLEASRHTYQKIDANLRPAMIDLCIPELKRLPPPAKRDFITAVKALSLADGKLSLFEFLIFTLLKKHLLPAKAPVSIAPVLLNINAELGLILSTVAHSGAKSEEEARKSFERGKEQGRLPNIKFSGVSSCNLEQLEKALLKLSKMSLERKEKILDACKAIILSDSKVTIDEKHMLRIVAELMDVPMPVIATPSPAQQIAAAQSAESAPKKSIRTMVLGLSAILIVVGLVNINDNWNFMQNAITTQGKVINLEWRNKSAKKNTSKVAYPVIEYKDKNGTPRRFTARFGSNPSSYNIGENVDLLISPQTGVAKLDVWFDLWGFSFTPVVMGLVMLALGLITRNITKSTSRRATS